MSWSGKLQGEEDEGGGDKDLGGKLCWLLPGAEGAGQVREPQAAGVGGPLLHSVREDKGVREGEDLPGVECEGDVRRQQEHL